MYTATEQYSIYSFHAFTFCSSDLYFTSLRLIWKKTLLLKKNQEYWHGEFARIFDLKIQVSQITNPRADGLGQLSTVTGRRFVTLSFVWEEVRKQKFVCQGI